MVQVDSLVGSVVDGRYAVTARIARGGMATVYRARDTRLERDVALKLMHPHLAEQPGFTERFTKEARAAASLSSPYVVSVHDRGVWNSAQGNFAYLVMECVDGPDVRSELTRLGSFNLASALILTEQTLRALAAAHRAGLAHRDVKPENVLLTEPLPPVRLFEQPTIHAKVTDFGLARIVSSTTTASSTPLMGTINYVAPEIITSESASATSDLYSVGIMLYEFLTGELPFQADTAIATAYKHINNPMPRVSEKADWIPASVDSFIALLTAKNPENRPANGAEALAALRAIIPGIPEEDLIRRIPVVPIRPAGSAPTDSVPPMIFPEGKVAPTQTMPAVPPTAVLSPVSPGSPEHIASPAEPREAVTRESVAPTEIAFDEIVTGVPAATTAAPTKPKRRRKLLGAVVVLLVLLGGVVGGWYFTSGPGQRVNVPDVVGQTYEQAQQVLAGEGLDSTLQRDYSDDVAVDHVITTEPGPGGKIHPDAAVAIIVSLGIEQVQVPAFEGLSVEEAREAAKAGRVTLNEREEYSNEVPLGRVISQGTAAQTTVNHDSAVDIVVSKGREPVKIPDVSGKAEADAVAALEEAGLVHETATEFSDTIAKGTVISQDPASGGTLYRGDTVKLTVSQGPEFIPVPNVFAKSEAEAVAILEEAGFTVKVKYELGGFLGLVREQSPASGQTARVGSEITISVV
ncbi:MAG: Stk1 family PASTA domain-containing Ser/Thr kinase [Ancrocorticia sp.]